MKNKTDILSLKMNINFAHSYIPIFIYHEKNLIVIRYDFANLQCM